MNWLSSSAAKSAELSHLMVVAQEGVLLTINDMLAGAWVANRFPCRLFALLEKFDAVVKLINSGILAIFVDLLKCGFFLCKPLGLSLPVLPALDHRCADELLYLLGEVFGNGVELAALFHNLAFNGKGVGLHLGEGKNGSCNNRFHLFISNVCYYNSLISFVCLNTSLIAIN